MRIGVFGGTFDPVHLGHLILAEQCREQAGLDQVWFVPAARPPHKLERTLTRFDQRVEMLALAIAGQMTFQISEVENNRPGPSYTAETLAELQQSHPDYAYHLLIGSDTIADLPAWHQPQKVIELAGLLVVSRTGHPVLSADAVRQALRLPGSLTLRYQVVDCPVIEIASRELRRRVAQGRSIRYLVPRAVECYIQEKRLYLK
jgi:nicotinate-nucleotide adenylyltransferase